MNRKKVAIILFIVMILSELFAGIVFLLPISGFFMYPFVSGFAVIIYEYQRINQRKTANSREEMPDGSLIQERDPLMVPSARRNPVLADIFNRLGYMERKGFEL